MADWPPLIGDVTKTQTLGCGHTNLTLHTGDTQLTKGVEIVGGAANVKGTWGLISAGPDFDAQGFLVQVLFYAVTNNGNCGLLDIGVGYPDRKIILPDLALQGYWMGNACSVVCYIPLPIAAGQPISARLQANTSGQKAYVMVTPIAQGFLPPSALGKAQALGVGKETLTSLTREVVPNQSTTHTKGTVTPLGGDPYSSPVLERDCSSLMIAIGKGGGTCVNARWFFDILVDGTVVLPNLAATSTSSSYTVFPLFIGPIPLCLKAGGTLQVQLQSSVIAGGNLRLAAYAFG